MSFEIRVIKIRLIVTAVWTKKLLSGAFKLIIKKVQSKSDSEIKRLNLNCRIIVKAFCEILTLGTTRMVLEILFETQRILHLAILGYYRKIIEIG